MTAAQCNFCQQAIEMRKLGHPRRFFQSTLDSGRVAQEFCHSRHSSESLMSRRLMIAILAASSCFLQTSITTRASDDASRPRTSDAPALKIPATLDRIVPELMQTHHVPGVSVVGIEHRRIAWHREFGVRQAGTDERVDQNTIFEACSLSKTPLAYLTLQLVERGKLDLERPLVEYLDTPYLDDEPRHKQITARMVLSHTTGFPNWRKGGWRKGGPLPIVFDPGTEFGYSGEGFLYLQRVIEHITGAPWETYVRNELFEPLCISSSSYVWQQKFAANAAAGHDARGKVKANRSLFRNANAGYSLYCTPTEYATFLLEILSTDRRACHALSAASVDAMLTRTTKATGRTPIDRIGRPFGKDVWWGLGWALDEAANGNRAYHSGSNGTGFRCYCEFDRQTGSGLVIMTNALGGRKLWQAVAAQVAPR